MVPWHYPLGVDLHAEPRRVRRHHVAVFGHAGDGADYFDGDAGVWPIQNSATGGSGVAIAKSFIGMVCL